MGKTTRSIISTLYTALTGTYPRISYASMDSDAAKHTFQMALDIIPEHLIKSVKGKVRTIVLINDVEIVFTTVANLIQKRNVLYKREAFKCDHSIYTWPTHEESLLLNRYEELHEPRT